MKLQSSISFKLPISLLNKIKLDAKARGVSVSFLIREILDREFLQKKTSNT